MIRKTTALCLSLGLVLTLAACGGSRLNPFNWFGKSEPVEKVEIEEKQTDQRERVANVLNMNVEPVASGVIVRAVGLTPNQGWWEAELVPQPLTADGILVLDFRISPPWDQTRVSTQRSREVTVALHLSNIKLANVRQIIVQGANDARSAGR
ncbi:hypothetical protein HOY34_20400 [Xinfangfangia sp. D13-10-4-6]|uniref:hypothetical protein n=1 Tax=Pseudogemmobacter hezensis TaxID=2737662 RepID=UPI0015528C9B|nr:hypothetical protein [Pseudogemmobacter hezensis]NPD17549.1 hypothetical protein [Pseudogemmobacter hezensis]